MSRGDDSSGRLRSRLTVREKPLQLWPQLLERLGAMAQRVFDARGQLAKRAVIFGNQEKRVVAEAARAAAIADDAAVTTPFRLSDDFPVRIADDDDADVVSGSLLFRHDGQFGQQLIVVRLVV